ncbi:MAG: OmpH family outer membrane protein [Bacteroidota bacterium]|nr:OmpH family outer membrane protein [Bacteroidota bacterium]
MIRKAFLSFLAFALIAMPTVTQAQTTPKFGHINLQELLTAMPKVTAAKQQIEAFGKPLEEELQALMAEYKKKVEEYQIYYTTWPESIRKQREGSIMQLEQNIQAFQEEATVEIEKKRTQLMEPIMNEVNATIKAVALENGYTYIFDTSLGVLLYFAASDDITPLVKRKLMIP